MARATETGIKASRSGIWRVRVGEEVVFESAGADGQALPLRQGIKKERREAMQAEAVEAALAAGPGATVEVWQVSTAARKGYQVFATITEES